MSRTLVERPACVALLTPRVIQDAAHHKKSGRKRSFRPLNFFHFFSPQKAASGVTSPWNAGKRKKSWSDTRKGGGLSAGLRFRDRCQRAPPVPSNVATRRGPWDMDYRP